MNPVIRMINYIEGIKTRKPRTFRVLLIMLWCLAPIEMGCLKLGIFSYKKLSKHEYSESDLKDLK